MTLSTIKFRGQAYSIRGLMVVISSTLLMVSISADYSFANLNTYIISYMRARTQENLTYADFAFVTQTKTFLIGFTCFLGGISSRKIGLRPTLILGSILGSGGYAFVYIALDIGLWAVVMGISVCGALGYSLLYTTTLSTTLKWFPGKGLMSSVALAGFGYGSMIWNPLQTAYVNPDNVEAVAVPGHEVDKYFVDEELLDRVPSMFLLLAAIFGALQVLALVFLREPTDQEAKELNSLTISEIGEDAAVEEKNSKKNDDLAVSSSVSPRKAVKTGQFWRMWFSFFTLSATINFLNSYQKSYAQIYIPDDQFLSVVAMVQNFMNGMSRVFGGMLFDRWGYRTAVIVLSCTTATFTFTFADLALFEDDIVSAKIFFFIWITSIFTVLPGAFSNYPAEVIRVFGPKHNATIMGLVLSCCIAVAIVLIIYTQTLFHVVGYVWTFFLLGILASLGAAITCSYPRGEKALSIRTKEQEAVPPATSA